MAVAPGQPRPQVGDVFQQRDIQRRHGVEAKQIEPGHAKMRARDGPVVEAGHAEGAAVANSPAEDFPAVRKIIAVLPDDLGRVRGHVRRDLAAEISTLGERPGKAWRVIAAPVPTVVAGSKIGRILEKSPVSSAAVGTVEMELVPLRMRVPPYVE